MTSEFKCFLLLRWFVGLAIHDTVRGPAARTKNRGWPLNSKMAQKLGTGIPAHGQLARLSQSASNNHTTRRAQGWRTGLCMAAMDTGERDGSCEQDGYRDGGAVGPACTRSNRDCGTRSVPSPNIAVAMA